MDRKISYLCPEHLKWDQNQWFLPSEQDDEHPRYFQSGNPPTSTAGWNNILELILKESKLTNNQLKIYLTPWEADIIY